MLKILLISPPVFDFYFTSARKEPLGLLYIKTALNTINGVHADIYDATLSGKVKKGAIPKCFGYLNEMYKEDISPFSLFNNYYRFGDSFKKIVTRITAGSYAIVGISALFSGYFPDVEDLIIQIKHNTNAVVVVGGWAVDAEKEKLFAQSHADFFLCGNGEETFPRLVKAYLHKTGFEKVPGIIYRKNWAVCSTVEQKQSPITNGYPERHGAYFFNKKRIAKVVVSRGCSYSCDFCTIHRNRRFSLRSIHSIERELSFLLGLGIEIVDFEDDNLFCSKEFSRKFTALLKKYHEKGLSYTAMNGITAKNILPWVDDIIDAGFIELNLSLVTSHRELADSVKRPFSMQVIKKIAARVNGRIPTQVFLIIGLPGSSPEMVVRDILALAELPVFIGVSPLYLVPGIPLFERMGIPPDRRRMRGSALYTFGDSFTREDVASLWKFARTMHWLKKTGAGFTDDDRESFSYFCKSMREKTWYRKTKRGAWEKGFSFSVRLPEKVTLCTLQGETLVYNFRDCSSARPDVQE
jgi:radical SAM superfamily enzyme YgiQ (UPF0313 family)